MVCDRRAGTFPMGRARQSQLEAKAQRAWRKPTAEEGLELTA